MDDPNNPNSSNTPPNPWAPPPPPIDPTQPTPPSPDLSTSPFGTPTIPSSSPNPEPSPVPEPTPVQSTPTWPSTPTSPLSGLTPDPLQSQTAPTLPPIATAPTDIWPQTPVGPTPIPAPEQAPMPAPEPIPTTPPPPTPEPVMTDISSQPASTFPQPPALDTTQTGAGTPSSPLDNPWGAPPQAPPIDSSLQTSPPTPETPIDPSSLGAQTEGAPTDLSHLIGNETAASNALSNTPPPDIISQETPPTSDTLVVPSANGAAEVPNLSTEAAHRGFPKWLIGLGIGLLIIVAGLSAFFILGWGKPPDTSSVPATQVEKTNEIKAPPPVVQPTPAPSTESASFGELEGGASASPQASSAAEILKARQGK